LFLLAAAWACGGGHPASDRDAGVDAAREHDAAADADASLLCTDDDADDDGVAGYACGGDDCDDSDPSTYPGAVDWHGWTITVIEEDATGPALAVGADGVVHVVYSTVDALRHATDAGGWVGETIDGSAAAGASSVVGGDGAVHVAYVELGVEGSTLKYAVGRGDGWALETVASPVEWVRWWVAAIALGSEGEVHVVYEGPDDDGYDSVMHGVRGEAGWEIEAVARTGERASRPSMAMTSDGAVHIGAYDFEANDLLHLERAGEEWPSEIIDNEAWSGRHSMVSSAEGLVVAYEAGGLSLASWRDSVWSREEILGGGSEPALALDAAGEAHIAFVREDSVFKGSIVTVRYATRAGEAWTDEEVDRVDDDVVSIAVDHAGRPHAAYTRHAVLHAVRDGTPDGIDQDCDGHDG
jgi:hypothetical protein